MTTAALSIDAEWSAIATAMDAFDANLAVARERTDKLLERQQQIMAEVAVVVDMWIMG